MKFVYGRTDEPIRWIVVEEKDGQVTAIAKYGVVVRSFDDIARKGRQTVYWENCGLKAYLETDFRGFFSEEETEKIREVFIPSAARLTAWMPERADRICYPSGLSVKEGAAVFREDGGGCVYWLSDTGRREGLSATVVLSNGMLYPSAYMYARNVCVRPAITLDREASNGIKRSGIRRHCGLVL